MDSNTSSKIAEIEKLLSSETREEVRRGLELTISEIGRCGTDSAQELFEALTSLFYIDPLDRPDLKPCLDEAIDLVIGLGDRVIPTLLERLNDSDLKAQIVIANVLGRLGADAVDPLLDAYHATNDPGKRSFILYALGHVRSPRAARGIPDLLEAAGAKDRNLRDTATRAIGRIFEWIPRGELPPGEIERVIDVLRANLADPSAGIRAKAIRSLGKLARFGHLTKEQCLWLYDTLKLVMGTDDRHAWDRAYIVRKEAREAMGHCYNMVHPDE